MADDLQNYKLQLQQVIPMKNTLDTEEIFNKHKNFN